MQNERPGRTLQTTALANKVWLRPGDRLGGPDSGCLQPARSRLVAIDDALRRLLFVRIRRRRGDAQRGSQEGAATAHLAAGVIAPYFLRISTVRSIGNARTVCPLPVTVTARSSEL